MTSSVELYWLPLGAGGHFVAFNGRIYEAIGARRDHRAPLDLYHSALVVTVPEGRFVIENAWPIPDGHPETRGATIQGPVFSRHLGRFRAFRYEVRCWPKGTIADIAYAVGGAQQLSRAETQSLRILDLISEVPPLVWGRRPAGSPEMWNSNSVISWVLTRAGLDANEIRPPTGGRAPGWATGIERADTERSPLGHSGPSWHNRRHARGSA